MNKALKLTTISLIALFSISASECQQGSTPKAASGVDKKTVSVATDAEGWSVEQRNVANRLRVDNLPGAIKHLYIISPYSGQTIIYSTVQGKVTSGGKRLTPTTVVVGTSDGGSRWGGFDAPGGNSTEEVLQDDGTYGSSCEYIYWWDTTGRYHQHFFTGGQIIHVAEQPLAVKNVIINISGDENK